MSSCSVIVSEPPANRIGPARALGATRRRVYGCGAAALAALAFATSHASAQDWTTYQPRGLGFQIDFPAPPESTTPRDTPAFTGSQAALAVRGRSVFLVYCDPVASQKSTVDPQTILDAALKAHKKNVVVQSELTISVGNLPARHLVTANHAYVYVTRLILLDNRLVQIIYGGPPGTQNSPEVRRFISSFVADCAVLRRC